MSWQLGAKSGEFWQLVCGELARPLGDFSFGASGKSGLPCVPQTMRGLFPRPVLGTAQNLLVQGLWESCHSDPFHSLTAFQLAVKKYFFSFFKKNKPLLFLLRCPVSAGRPRLAICQQKHHWVYVLGRGGVGTFSFTWGGGLGGWGRAGQLAAEFGTVA